MNYDLGETEYRRAGLERLREAWRLLQDEMFAGSVYLSGRAVEAMLRALIWKFDTEIRAGKKSLDAGHDLRLLLDRVTDLGVLRDPTHRNTLTLDIQRVGRLWFNNMRFVSTERMRTMWWRLGETKKRRTLKQAVRDYHFRCSEIVKRCEALCE